MNPAQSCVFCTVQYLSNSVLTKNMLSVFRPFFRWLDSLSSLLFSSQKVIRRCLRTMPKTFPTELDIVIPDVQRGKHPHGQCKYNLKPKSPLLALLYLFVELLKSIFVGRPSVSQVCMLWEWKFQNINPLLKCLWIIPHFFWIIFSIVKLDFWHF